MHGPTLESGESIVLSGSDSKVPKNVGPMNGGDTHAHEIDTSPNVALDSGVLKTPESDSGNHSIAGDAGKHAAPMHGAGVHDFEPSSIAQGGSGWNVGAPGDSFHFKDEISGSKGSRVTDVAELNGIPASTSHREDAAGTHGPLAISEGAQAIGLPSPEQYPDDEFHIVAHHAPIALVTHVQHDLIV